MYERSAPAWWIAFVATTALLSVSFGPPVLRLRSNFGKSDEVTSILIRWPLPNWMLVAIGVGWMV